MPHDSAGVHSPQFHWFLPTRGDSSDPGQVPAFGSTELGAAGRFPTLEYLTEVAQAAHGDHRSHDERYDQTRESLDVIVPLLRGQEATFSGKFVDIRKAKLDRQNRSTVSGRSLPGR